MRVTVEVTALFTKDGLIKPLSFIWNDGNTYKIDKVFEIKNASSLKKSGEGKRYLCSVGNKSITMFFEDGIWSIET